MRKILLFLCAASMVFVFVGSVDATIVRYDFTKGWATSPSMDFTKLGVTTTVTATYNGFKKAADVALRKKGLGVKNSWWDNSDIDGSWRDDYLTFSFSHPVDLLGLNFGHDSKNDEFDLFVNRVLTDKNRETKVKGGWTSFALGSRVGTSFTIRADGWNDDFTVSGLEVHAPEPSSILLLGFGLLGLAGFGRRRLKKKAN